MAPHQLLPLPAQVSDLVIAFKQGPAHVMSTFGQARSPLGGAPAAAALVAATHRAPALRSIALRRPQAVAYATLAWALLTAPLFYVVARLVAAALRRLSPQHDEASAVGLRGRAAKSP